MAKKKFYAVRIGRNPGIYESWEQCKQQVGQYSGARYKSFPTLDQAQAYLSDAVEVLTMPEADEKTLTAYVDGSYDESAKRYSYGAVYIFPDGTEKHECGVGQDESLACSRNVSGELLGAMKAMEFAAAHGFERLIIKHDYEGIAAWATGAWKAESAAARQFVEFYKSFSMEIYFVKVAAHSAVLHNEQADLLAKKALGL